tara:strand:- start:1361 stop:1792 length:432 start_codon:yes stop_codon:yes gene_type:complete
VGVRKIDVITEGKDCVIGLRLTDLNGLVEVGISPENLEPYFCRTQLDDSDRKRILKAGYKNHKKSWTEENDQQLKDLFKELDGDKRKVARMMQRTDRAISLRLKNLNTNSEPLLPKETKHEITGSAAVGGFQIQVDKRGDFLM